MAAPRADDMLIHILTVLSESEIMSAKSIRVLLIDEMNVDEYEQKRKIYTEGRRHVNAFDMNMYNAILFLVKRKCISSNTNGYFLTPISTMKAPYEQ